MFGFGTGGFIIYGDKMQAYSSILRGSLEMILATLGGIQYTEMSKINAWITPLFSFSYLIFANTIFLKTFLLIIQEEYNEYFQAYSAKGGHLITMVISSCKEFTEFIRVDLLRLSHGIELIGNKKERYKWKGSLKKKFQYTFYYWELYLLHKLLSLSNFILVYVLNYIKAGNKFHSEVSKKDSNITRNFISPEEVVSKFEAPNWHPDLSHYDERFSEIKFLKRILDADRQGQLAHKGLNLCNPSVWMSEINAFMTNNAALKVGLGFESDINHYKKHQDLLLFTDREIDKLYKIAELMKIEANITEGVLRKLEQDQHVVEEEFSNILWSGEDLTTEIGRGRLFINLVLMDIFSRKGSKKKKMNQSLGFSLSDQTKTFNFNFKKEESFQFEKMKGNLLEHNVLPNLSEEDKANIRKLWFSLKPEVRGELWLTKVNRPFSSIKKFAILYSIGTSL